MEDPSPEPPRRRGPESGVRAPYEETIDSWLDDDRGIWREQRHTARVYMRLRDEQGCTDGRPTMQRHVKRRREEMARECDRRDAEWFLTPRWLPGEAPAPGLGQLWGEERDIHHQRRVQQMGHGLRRRQARGGHRRTRGAPRQARGVRRTQPQAREVSHAGKVGKVETAARP